MSRQLCKLHPQWYYQREHGCPYCLKALRTANADLEKRLVEMGKDTRNAKENENHHARRAAELRSDLAAANEKLATLAGLLGQARCPNCDGGGTIVYTGTKHDEPDDIGPCQWCWEKNAILAATTEKEG